MDDVLNWLWQGGVVAVAAGLMLRVLDRARSSVRCVICWAALLVILMLPLVSLMNAPSPVARAASAGALVTLPSAWWSSSLTIAVVWALWAGFSALRLARAAFLVRRAKVRSVPCPPRTEASLTEWQRVRGDARAADLVVSDRVHAAAVLGCGRPVIAVAPALLDSLTADELDQVVIHEWAHVQRRDDIANLGRLLIHAVAGWHPAVWWLDRRLALEQELACDEIVVAVTRASKPYASCLVKLAGLRQRHAELLTVPGALASGGLRRRVVRVLTRTDFPSSAWARAVTALVIVSLWLIAAGIAPVRVVQGAVAATISRVLQPVVTAAPAQPVLPPDAEKERKHDAVNADRATAIPSAPDAPLDSTRVAAAAVDPALPRLADGRAHPDPSTPVPPSDSSPRDGHNELAAAPLAAPISPLTLAPAGVDAASRAVWKPAADAGIAIGRGSKDAGVATAGTFTRFAKKIAGSF